LKGVWRSAERPLTVPASDVASEVIWSCTAAVGVFDHGGRIAYSNPSFQQLERDIGLVDGRGYLISPAMEDARRGALHHRAAHATRSAAIIISGRSFAVEVIPLEAAPEWAAVVIYRSESEGERPTDALTIPVLVHELRGSLLLAQESLETLTQMAADGPARLRSAVAREGRALARLTGLVKGLGDLSRAQALERSRASWTMVDLSEHVQEIALAYSDVALARGLELLVAVEPGVPAIRGNADLLARSITNLVDNAVKYSTSPGSVRIAVERRGALAVVEVADSGPGIAPKDQTRVFAEFFRLTQEGASGPSGSGLGLAVARRVAEAHGGRLSLESRPGAGSAFRLSFLLTPHG